MKRKSISIYSILISLVFLFAIIYFAAAMIIEYNDGMYRADRQFSLLCEHVENSTDGFPSIDFIEENGSFAAVTIFKNKRCIFSYPNENAQNIESTKFIRVGKRTIENGNSSLYLVAAVYILRPSAIFYYGKIAFVIILIATLFTIGLIIYYSIKDGGESEEIDEEHSEGENLSDTDGASPKNDAEAESEDANNTTEKQNGDESADKDDANKDINEEPSEHNNGNVAVVNESEETTNKNGDEENGENNNEHAENKTDESTESEQTRNLNESAHTDDNADSEEQDDNEIQDDYDGQAQTEQDSACTEETSNHDEQNINDAIKASNEIEINEAQGIFSVSTGFCLQNQLQTRLDAELVRCGASELDLSLFIVKITGSEISEETAKKIGERLLSKIQFRDRIFEYGESSFAIIISEIEIAKAEDFAEELYNDIAGILGNTNAQCFIGISSRTMRVISATRLINEAEEALEHAVKDGKSKIIGFHVDIEKYRQFIKNETE